MPPHRIQDAGARRKALNPDQSFIVQAPAGSGKTELLTQRYLKLLTCVKAPEEIIAITFTRKAAAEMRHRIMAAVARARENPPPEAEPLRTTWELARAVLDYDSTQGWGLEQHPTRLRIQTIDSLCASLTRQMPLLSRFGTQPGVMEKAEALYRQAARATLAEVESSARWSVSVEALLRHLDNNWGKIETLLAAMLARRDQWLRHLASNKELRREALEKPLQAAIEAGLKRVSECCPDKIMEEWLGFARFAAGNLVDDNPASPLGACRDLKARPGTHVKALPQWLGLAHLLLSSEGAWRKQANKTLGFPAPSAARHPEEKAVFKARKEAFVNFLGCRRKEESFHCALQALRSLPPAHYTKAQWGIMAALTQLLPLAVAQLQLVFQEQGEVDFTEVAQRAVLALGEPEAPTDLALALDYRIRHLLIDEFQDTSLSQFILLERLTAGWEVNDGRTLFVVGDPMQSIYRFREAEVGLYLQARHQGVGQLQPTPLTLSVNFRSQQGIVDWANDSFRQVFPSAEDIAAGAVSYSPSHAFHPPLEGKAVHVHPSFGQDQVGEAETVVRLVQEAKQTAPCSSVAILVRSRSHLAEIVPLLREAGLRFRAIEIEPLGSRPVVQDLLALTKALFHAADRLSWLTILRAPWCGLRLSDLQGLVGEDLQAILWDQINAAAYPRPLSEEGQQRLARFRQIMAKALAGRRRVSPRRLVEGTWLALGGPACVAEPAALEEAKVYLELLEQQTVANELIDFGALDEAVAGLFAPPDTAADETLQVMTIHRAKGLEFDSVIVPGLGRPPRHKSNQLLLWAERPVSDQKSGGGNQLLLAPIAETGRESDAIYQYIKGLHEEKDRFENDRLLYVAATRARYRLHLLSQVMLDGEGRPKAPSRHSLLACLWPVVRAEFETAAASWKEIPIPEERQNTAGRQLSGYFSRLVADWQCPEPAPGVEVKLFSLPETISALNLIEFDWAGEIARYVGSVVHRYLQVIAQEGIEHWHGTRIASLAPALGQAFKGKGVADDQLEHAVQRAQEVLTRTLEDERGRWILAPCHQEVRNEYPLSGILKGQIVRAVIDRTFVDQTGVRWIVDYKTGAHEGGDLDAFLDREQERYRPQLESYAALMALKEPEREKIQVGLYYPQFSGWREWCWLKSATLPCCARLI